MVIDSHEHIMFPIKMQLDKMDAAGVDKTILFCTAPHPEKAGTLSELEAEMAALNKILAGSNTKEDNSNRLKKNVAEVVEAIKAYPGRFLGFGAVPLGMELKESEEWIDAQIISNSLYGIGEFSDPEHLWLQLGTGYTMDGFRKAVKAAVAGSQEPAKKAWYRVRKAWADASSQKGAFQDLSNARKCADKNPGHSVFDESGKAIYKGKGSRK